MKAETIELRESWGREGCTALLQIKSFRPQSAFSLSFFFFEYATRFFLFYLKFSLLSLSLAFAPYRPSSSVTFPKAFEVQQGKKKKKRKKGDWDSAIPNPRTTSMPFLFIHCVCFDDLNIVYRHTRKFKSCFSLFE